jgi:hypothetical protein
MKASIISLITILSSSILIATPAKSEILTIATTNDGKDVYFIDTRTINLDRLTTTASVNARYKSPSYGSLSITTRWVVNCSDKSMGVIGDARYSLNGKFLGSDLNQSEWASVKPNSVKKAIYNFLCNEYKR